MLTQNNDFEILGKRLDVLEGKLASLTDEVTKLVSNQTVIIPLKKLKQISAKEFLISKKTKKEVQNTLLLCFFLENQMGFSNFNISDLKEVFRQAKEQLPKNLHDMINKNITKGFLMETIEPKDGKKAWTVTSSGERFVEKGLNE